MKITKFFFGKKKMKKRTKKYPFVIQKRDSDIYQVVIILAIVLLYIQTEQLIIISKNSFDWCIDDPDVIDLVMLWVNGSDPEWHERMLNTSKYYNHPIKNKFFQQRYVEHEELKWALRSIEKFAPWINRIHIVTDNQFPYWIKRDHPKIHWVNHETLFYPGFHSFKPDSMYLSSYRVPGIARRAILMDDDYLFLNKVTKSDFFDEFGRTKIHTQPHSWFKGKCSNDNSRSMYFYARNISNLAIKAIFHNAPDLFDAHIQTPFDMSVLFQLISQINTSDTVFYPFRKCGDFQAQTLYMEYSFSLNLSVKIGNRDKVGIFDTKSLQKLSQRKTLPKFSCINTYNPDYYESFLSSVFPEKSSFEI